MAQTKQITFNVEGERIQIKARRCAGLRYTVEVNGWQCRTATNMSLFDDNSDYNNQALDQAIEKGLAKWLKQKTLEG
jgi:hypothetical protein